MVQNRFHYAITGRTAAEIIHASADHTKPHTGLTTWQHAPDGRILKSDVFVTKNYLSSREIRALERTVTAYFDYIEGQIERGHLFTMDEFAMSIDKVLTFIDYKILPDRGSISAGQAKAKAEAEYALCDPTQPINSDFDIAVKELLDRE